MTSMFCSACWGCSDLRLMDRQSRQQMMDCYRCLRFGLKLMEMVEYLQDPAPGFQNIQMVPGLPHTTLSQVNAFQDGSCSPSAITVFTSIRHSIQTIMERHG